MIYKLFTEKDSTIYSENNSKNSGLDSILEISRINSDNYVTESASSRFLIKFSASEISSLISESIGSGNFKSYLKLYLAQASELPKDYTIIGYPISESWDVGTGRFNDTPITQNGVSWTYRTYNTSSLWRSSSFSPSVTASFTPSNPGGGNWYTSSFVTQSFGIYNEKDLSLDITNIVRLWNSGTIPNNGMIFMLSGSTFERGDLFSLKYFSRDTNTIYPPILEFRWDDSSYAAPTASILTNENMLVSLDNNNVEYNKESVKRFRVSVRDKYPTRTFTTSSLYSVVKFLPTSSYYAVKDLDTDNYVIEFDESYTKISADTTSNYFDINMSGLEPERYYKIIIKSRFGGTSFIYDEQYYFKVKK